MFDLDGTLVQSEKLKALSYALPLSACGSYPIRTREPSKPIGR